MSNARSKEDMRALAKRLASIQPEQRLVIAANIAGHGLMRPQWWVRACVAIGAWRNGLPREVMWALCMQRFPTVANQTLEGTVRWIVSGRDADGQGVGGFNQREVDQLERWLSL